MKKVRERPSTCQPMGKFLGDALLLEFLLTKKACIEIIKNCTNLENMVPWITKSLVPKKGANFVVVYIAITDDFATIAPLLSSKYVHFDISFPLFDNDALLITSRFHFFVYHRKVFISLL